MVKEQIAVRLHKETLDELNRVAQEMRLSRTTVFQLAINEYLQKHKPADRTSETRPPYKADPHLT